jgi:5-(carboxyamino)imidazole ribonucleotide synthase
MQALKPGSTIGILGSGQLGRMLAMAAARLGLKCHIYSDTPGPAFDVAAVHTIAPYEDAAKLEAFARSVNAVTYEFENVPLAAAEVAQRVCPLHPCPLALKVAQDRLEEKTFISRLGVPVAPFAAVETSTDLGAALNAVGAPAILKTRRLGYDGKGQVRISSADELVPAFMTVGGVPCVLEGVVKFAFEVSVLIVRGADGTSSCYDIPINRHEAGILRTSTVPVDMPAGHQERAREIAHTIAEALGYVGLLGVEMFYVGGPEPLLVNEIAPRVHNSGHWTTDACPVSQFENHMRAVAGWPLGSTDRHSNARMQNLIGAEVKDWAALAAAPGACVHIYGKGEARPGRKMGHVTWITPR